jgi:hypothetical protein
MIDIARVSQRAWAASRLRDWQNKDEKQSLITGIGDQARSVKAKDPRERDDPEGLTEPRRTSSVLDEELLETRERAEYQAADQGETGSGLCAVSLSIGPAMS